MLSLEILTSTMLSASWDPAETANSRIEYRNKKAKPTLHQPSSQRSRKQLNG
jgi:hypothetical protein